MQFRLSKDAARKAISYILNVVGGDPTILISTDEKRPNKVTIEGAGKGTYVRTMIDGDTLPQGIIPVDGAHLASIKFPADVVFTTDFSSKLNYESGTFKGNLPLSSNGGYVKTQRPRDTGDVEWITVDKNMLVTATKATVFESTIKVAAEGITMKFGDRFIMHAFDGVRASLYVEDLPTPVTPTVCVLSSKFFDAITKIAGDESTIQLAVVGGSIRVKTANTLISYPQLQVESTDIYAHIHNLFQNAIDGEVTVSAKRLTAAITAMASVVHGGIDYNHHFVFSILPDQNTIGLSLNTDTGHVVDAVVVDGEMKAGTFVLPGKHLAEMLPLLTGDVLIRIYTVGAARMVSFTCNDGKSTILMSGVNTD